jgi:hypothetical protein
LKSTGAKFFPAREDAEAKNGKAKDRRTPVWKERSCSRRTGSRTVAEIFVNLAEAGKKIGFEKFAEMS